MKSSEDVVVIGLCKLGEGERQKLPPIIDTAYDAAGWWMLAAAAVAAHVGIQEEYVCHTCGKLCVPSKQAWYDT